MTTRKARAKTKADSLRNDNQKGDGKDQDERGGRVGAAGISLEDALCLP
jgi:hypothetical protein